MAAEAMIAILDAPFPRALMIWWVVSNTILATKLNLEGLISCKKGYLKIEFQDNRDSDVSNIKKNFFAGVEW